MGLDINIDIDGLVSQFKEFEAEITEAVKGAVKLLALSGHAKVLEIASRKLHSTLNEFKQNLEFRETEGVYSIVIPDKIAWIEEGYHAGSQLDFLLKSPKAKINAKGERYLVVPFSHNKAPQNQTPMAQSITQTMRQELKKRNIPYTKLERGPDGKPKEGTLHRLNLGGLQRGATKHNEAWSSPALNGLNIKQTMNHDTGKVDRSMTTYRIASESMRGRKWNRPAKEGLQSLVTTYYELSDEWNEKILPDIIAKFTNR